MAAFNEILTGRYNRFLQKLLQMKGGPPAAQLASEIGAQIPLFHGAETMYLQGWELFGGGVNVSAVAGQTSGFRLRNPAGSGVILVVTKLFAWSSVASQFNLFVGGIAADLTINTIIGFDSRGRGQSTGILSQGTNPSIFGTNIGNYIVQQPIGLGIEIFKDNDEIPLMPGSAFELRTNIQNTGLLGSIWWRE